MHDLNGRGQRPVTAARESYAHLRDAALTRHLYAGWRKVILKTSSGRPRRASTGQSGRWPGRYHQRQIRVLHQRTAYLIEDGKNCRARSRVQRLIGNGPEVMNRRVHWSATICSSTAAW